MDKHQRHALVEQLFLATIALDPEDRASFLSSSCGSDQDLYEEVKALVTADEQAEEFLSCSLAPAATTAILAEENAAFTGKTFGQYLILDLLGQGGMGEVYRARDTRLDRDVAIKFVSRNLAREELRLRRLEREARLLASLSHPNIATIYGLEYFGESRLLVMELVEGETLDRLIARGPLPVEQSLRVFRQIALALEAAHGRGIIHRDLKPSNIKLTPEANVKLLDFGLAKNLDLTVSMEAHSLEQSASLTGPGLVVGTPGYMSPEQARGEELDRRSDIWAFGAVFFEALTGGPAFRGTSVAETLANILSREPSWTSLPTNTPSGVERLIRQCLEKEAVRRPENLANAISLLSQENMDGTPSWQRSPSDHSHSVVDQARELLPLADEVGTLSARRDHKTATSRLSRNRVFWVPAAVIVAALVSFVGWTKLKAPASTAALLESIAVLPFDNLSADPDQEYFVAGMQDAVTNELSRVRALRVTSRTSTSKYRNSGKSLQEISRELKVDGILEGSVLRSGNTVRVQVQLIRAMPEERPIWAQSYEREMGSVLELHGDMARSIANAIRITITPEEEARLLTSRRVKPDAYEAYLRGMYYLNKFTPEGFERGLAFLHEAIDKDPADPLPYAGLALGYELIGHGPEPQAFRRTKSLALKALGMDETLAEAHEAVAEIALYWEWDWAAAERSFRRALELNPSLPVAHAHYSWLLLLQGSHNIAVREMRTAIELDPLNPLYPSWLGWIYWALGDYDKAWAAAQQSLAQNRDFVWGLQVSSSILAEKGKHEESVATMKRLVAATPSMKWALGYVLVRAGKHDEARKVAAELKSSLKPINAWGLAEIYASLGETDEALRWIDSGTDQRFSWIPWMGMHRPFRLLYEDPRFQAKLRNLNLPKVN